MGVLKTSSGQSLHIVTRRCEKNPARRGRRPIPPLPGSWAKCACCGGRFELNAHQRSSIRRGEMYAYYACSSKCQLEHTQKLYNAEIGRKNAHKISAWRLKHWEGVSAYYRKVNGRHEHRVVAEEKYGRKLTFDDVVHHIDGDKRNNHPDNLVVLTRSEHCHAHDFGRRKSGS